MALRQWIALRQELIDYLSPISEGASLLSARELIDPKFFGVDEATLQDMINGLIDDDIVIERDDVHTGERMIGLRELVEKSEAEYDLLKDRVYKMAKSLGLWPKWNPDQGWRLVNGGGFTEYEGPMRELEHYLNSLVSSETAGNH